MRKELQSNPSMQCSVCGQWKRLVNKGETEDAGNLRFYPCCGDNGEYEHIKPVCDECCKNNCPYRPRFPKDVVIIYYIYWAKGHGIGKNWYCAEMNGDVIDYHTKWTLKKNAEEKGLPWMVVRFHKKGGRSIVEKSPSSNPH